ACTLRETELVKRLLKRRRRSFKGIQWVFAETRIAGIEGTQGLPILRFQRQRVGRVLEGGVGVESGKLAEIKLQAAQLHDFLHDRMDLCPEHLLGPGDGAGA